MSETLPLLAFQAMLLFARLGAAVLLLPGLGELDVPPTVRLALGLALVALLGPLLGPGLPGLPEQPAELLRLVLLEIVVGLWLGLLARLVSMALVQAGQIVALMMGMASPLQPDAVLGGQGTATGRLFGLLAAVLVLESGLWGLPLRALAESYALLPPGQPWAPGAGAEALAGAVAGSFALALRLAGPLVLAAVLGNLALGLLSRLAPQVPAFLVAAPGQVLAGLLLLALLLPPLLAAWLATARDAFLHLPAPP